MTEVYEFLLQQAKLFGVSIVESPSSSFYTFNVKCIYLEPAPIELRVLYLAHELGHHIDLMCLPKKYKDHSDRMRNLFSLGLRDTEVKMGVVYRERRAWKYARMLLKLAGYNDWSRFRIEKRQALKSYENSI